MSYVIDFREHNPPKDNTFHGIRRGDRVTSSHVNIESWLSKSRYASINTRVKEMIYGDETVSSAYPDCIFVYGRSNPYVRFADSVAPRYLYVTPFCAQFILDA